MCFVYFCFLCSSASGARARRARVVGSGIAVIVMSLPSPPRYEKMRS